MSMIVDKKWFGLWKDWKFGIYYNWCGYFDPHPELHISILGLHFMFRMPWAHKKWDEECIPPCYGIQIHDATLWIHYGGKGNWNGGSKYWAWDIPFFTQVHMDNKWTVETADGMVPTSSLIPDDGKYHYYAESDKIIKHTYNYTDKYDGAVIKATYWVEHREWRRKWLTWCKLFTLERNYIEIEFAEEVGKRKGSWKGGCLGCSYNLKKGETPEECIKRMEKEREF